MLSVGAVRWAKIASFRGNFRLMMNWARIIAGRIFLLLAFLLSLTFCTALPALAQSNLLNNSDLEAGSSMPDSWHPSRRSGCESFEWFHPGGTPGELRINSAPGADAAWVQTVSVSPGWYEFSADLRTEDGGPIGGALLAVKQDRYSVTALWRNRDWERHEFYVRVWGPDSLEVQCGLSSPDLRTKVFCRNLTLTRISGAPPAGAQRFDLPKPRPSAGVNWVSLSLVLVLGLLGFVYYRFADGATLWDPAQAKIGSEESGRRDSWRTVGVVLGFIVLLMAIFAVTRVELVPGAGLSIVTPAAVRSDEPHYVILINSLLFDRDFELQDDYERVYEGGLDAGARFKGHDLDHHTLLVNRRTGHHAFASENSPNSVIPCDPEFIPSDDVYEVSAHPVGFSILMALAVAPFQPAIGDVEGEVAIVLALISWLGALMTYLAGRTVGMGRTRAMLAALLLVAGSPWLAYSRSFFPEATIGLALIVALWAIVTDRPILVGIATAVAAILKPPFAVIGIAFIINEIYAGRRRNAAKIGVVLALCGAPMLAFNYWLAGTPVISGNASWVQGSRLQSLYDTFLEPGHALLYFVPWVVIAFIAIERAFRSPEPDAKLLRPMALPLVLYLVLLSGSGTGPGLCYGPRYWIPFMPWFALAIMQSVNRARRPAILACGVLVLVAILIAIPGALRYPQIFSQVPWAAWQFK
jgi:hypothetical protein